MHELHCDRQRVHSTLHDSLTSLFYSSFVSERERQRLDDIFSIYVEFSSLRIDSKIEMLEQVANSFT